MTATLDDRIAAALGHAPVHTLLLSGGLGSAIYRLTMADGTRMVAKQGAVNANFTLEGMMLRYLKEHSRLPVPEVYHAADDLLVTAFVHGDNYIDTDAQIHAAELMAELHGISAEKFGFERSTLIGGLDQPNPWSGSWLEFFRDQRLMHMAEEVMAADLLPTRLMARLEKLAANLERWIDEPARPALIHGDIWTGNVLARGGRITGFLDPAIYYADPEIELAFTTLFGTFGPSFFERYAEVRPIRPGFRDARRDIYNIYPLLVHARLFGGRYINSVARVLDLLGY